MILIKPGRGLLIKENGRLDSWSVLPGSLAHIRPLSAMQWLTSVKSLRLRRPTIPSLGDSFEITRSRTAHMIQPVITFHGGGHGVRNRFSGTRKNPRVANDFSPPPGNYRAPHFRRNFRVTPWKSYSHSSGSRVHLWNLQLLDRNDMPATSFPKNKHRNKSCRSNYFKLRNTFKRYRIE